MHYSLIELHLISAAGRDDDFNEQAAVDVIQACSREFEHDYQLLATIVSKALQKRLEEV